MIFRQEKNWCMCMRKMYWQKTSVNCVPITLMLMKTHHILEGLEGNWKGLSDPNRERVHLSNSTLHNNNVFIHYFNHKKKKNQVVLQVTQYDNINNYIILKLGNPRVSTCIRRTGKLVKNMLGDYSMFYDTTTIASGKSKKV